MPDKETVHFKLGIGATYWKKVPQYSILLNDNVIKENASIDTPSDEFEYVEFDADLVEDETYVLKIRLENKDNSDTVENEDKTAILQDMLLNIHSLEIEEIDLGELIRTHTVFVADDPARPELKNCVNLGWNGTWSLPFTSPFYIWLLENL
jgi:hypothetical protein